MTKKSEKILKELSPEFQVWTRDFSDFIQWQHYGIIGPDTPEYGLWDSMEYLYATLMKSMIRMSGIKDKWEGPAYLPLAVKAGLDVHFRSEKLEYPFHFGTDEQGFYMNVYLYDSEHIRKMNDSFWYAVGELTQFGDLELWESKVLPQSRKKQEPWFHRKAKSVIFQLIQNALAWEKEEGIIEDMGMLIVRWRHETSWEELLRKGSAAFHNLYRINEALWKKNR